MKMKRRIPLGLALSRWFSSLEPSRTRLNAALTRLMCWLRGGARGNIN
ncbi:MAG: hypothetical protein LBI64_09000 [Coriobacteriales bacterium]|nr:hypothetical protein [Coriobacteriales bacterium]